MVQVGILVDGQDSANTLPFTLTVPILNRALGAPLVLLLRRGKTVTSEMVVE